MPRTSPRRLFLYLLCLLSGLLLAANLHLAQYRDQPTAPLADMETEAPSLPPVLTEVKLNQTLPVPELVPVISETKPIAKHTHTTITMPTKQIEEGMNTFPDRPWYMVGGQVPAKTPDIGNDRKFALFPEDDPGSDRIHEQLMYLPPNISLSKTPTKIILLWNGASSWGNLRMGGGELVKQQCPVHQCSITSDRSQAMDASLILFKDHFSLPTNSPKYGPRPLDQVWMLYMLECPLHTQVFTKDQLSVFNWTATYRSDSTVVAPYEKWSYHKEGVHSLPLQRNFAANKTKKVAWFVSNCGARNGRLQYANELAKYIQVDIFGACGSMRCPRSNAEHCFSMLNTHYKFYLAFENSNCQDYITEKFFVNGLGHDVIPIVMGARPQDYARSAPYNSYIHVEQFAGPKELAEYLLELDRDNDKYNEYFKWKGTGEFVNTRFFCRVCSLLHSDQKRSPRNNHYTDINKWWRGDGVCSNSGWKKDGDKEQKVETEKEEEEEEVEVEREHKVETKEFKDLLHEEDFRDKTDREVWTWGDETFNVLGDGNPDRSE